MTVFTRIRDMYNERRRRIDVEVLWPSCRDQAESLEYARAAFSLHAHSDPAWLRLGHDEIVRRIEALE